MNTTNKTRRPMRLMPGIVIQAVQGEINRLKTVKPGTPDYGNALWQIGLYEDQIEALKYRPTVGDVAGWGGEWLGVIRNWMQTHARNGSDVTWGSHEALHLTSTLTPFSMEYLAAQIASAAIIGHLGVWPEEKNKNV